MEAIAPMKASALASWLGWTGDVCSESVEWISDGRALYRLSALQPATIQTLRGVRGTRTIQRERVDRHGFEKLLTDFEPVHSVDEEADCSIDCIELATETTTWRFREVYVLRLTSALPDADLYVAQFRDDGQTHPKEHALVAKINGEIVAILMGVVTERRVNESAVTP